MRPSLAVLFFLFRRIAVGQKLWQFPSECWHSSDGRYYDPLACWLWHLQVNIPDQSFHSGLVSIEISHLHCTNFTVGALLSTYSAPSTLQWNAQNVSAICQGSYQLTGAIIAGEIYAQINSTDHAMDIALQISSSSDAVTPNSTILRPRAVHTIKCQTNIQLEDLQFTGSISAKIVNVFAKQISNYVTGAIQQQICPLFSTQVDPWMTQQLSKVNEWIDRILMPSSRLTSKELTPLLVIPDQQISDETIHSTKSNFVNLQNDVPLLKNSMDWLNDVLIQPHLNEGLLPHHWLPNNQTEDSYSCGFCFDGWNGVMQSLIVIHRPNGVTIPLPFQNISILVPQYAQLELQMHNLSIVSGLDHWEHMDLLRIQSFNAITSLLENRNLTVRCDMKIIIQTIPDGIFQGDDLIEYFSVQLHAESLKVLLDLQLDYQAQVLQALTMDTIIDLIHGILAKNETRTRQPLDDLLHGVDRLEASELNADMSLSSLLLIPRVNSSMPVRTLEEDLDGALNNLFRLILSDYQPLVQALIKASMNGFAKEALNEFLNNTISSGDGTLSNQSARKHIEQFDAGDDVNITEYLASLNDFLNQPRTIGNLNQYVDCIGNFMARVVELHWASSPLAVKSKLLELESFLIESLGRFQEMQVLAPDGGQRFNTSTMYGSTFNIGTKPLVTAAGIFFFAPLNITAAIDWETNLDGIFLWFKSALSYNMSELRRLSLSHVLKHDQCLLMPLSMSFDPTNSTLRRFQTKVRVILQSPNWNRTFMISLDSDDYPEVQKSIFQLFNWAVTSTKDLLASTSKSLLTHATYSCEGVTPPPNHSDDNEVEPISYSSIFLVIGAVLIFAQPVLLLLKTAPVTRDERSLHRQTIPALEEPLFNDPSIMFDQSDDGLTVSETLPRTCLMHSANVPYFFRVFVPVLILSTTLLLVSSNLNVGAAVDLVIRSGDEAIRFPPLFEFSLVNTAKEMLHAKIYPLFFLVVAFSGIWPYCKLILMLISWATETSFLSVTRRERLLLALDALSKFSLVDTYVLVLFVVAFRYHLDLSPEQNESLALDVYVTPLFGFYGFLLATALSLIAGHLLVYYHRRVRLSHKGASSNETETLINHRYFIEGHKLRLSQNFCICVASTITLTLFLLGLGMTRKCFHFEFDGLGGIVLGEKRRKSYSLLSLGSSLANSVENSDGAGIFLLRCAYYFYAAFTPFATLLFLATFIAVPMTTHGQLALITLAEIANAWSAVEVFALSIVAALLQISTFSTFMIGNRCDLLHKILEDQSEAQIDSCFSVNASVSWDSAFLLVAVLLNSACVAVVLRLAHLAIDERLEQVIDNDDNAPPEMGQSGRTFAERLAANHWSSWIVDSETDYAVVFSVESEAATEVATAVEESVTSFPPEIFEGAWKKPSDHDPTLRKWTEAESTGSGQALTE
ncbi:hypothetical protein FisN_7Lh008 [Fistulifera solaris]|uniref:Uncharacterized protein n=1 Tax=Fistulifera solaris TaxID=1519565 RepID=A0A1Z5JCE6_FISSO|nr:hypothetical protein FisN_7Lh008 [Fistulifera solaris]|eukprot:GAX11649.1 hypothetical protein FisN_7Lh008 [Fistulifera solaris]